MFRHCKYNQPTSLVVPYHAEFDSELCFTNAALFASEPLRFQSLDQITFRLPVPIGAVLHLTSKVVKTTRPHSGRDGEAKAHIQVKAEVEEVETGVSAALCYAGIAQLILLVEERDQYFLLYHGER